MTLVLDGDKPNSKKGIHKTDLFFYCWLGLGLLGALVVLIAMLLPATRHGPPEGRVRCQSNLKQIVLALHHYHDAYGSFPPAAINDSNGRPMHSWRVLILPQLGEEGLYSEYDFTEPWDGPNNRRLHDRIVESYHCKAQITKSSPTTCTYVAIVGNETLWPMTQSVSFDEIADEPSDTIIVIEIANSDIHWMEPRDLFFHELLLDEAKFRDRPSLHLLFEGHAGITNCAFADGRVRQISLQIDALTLKALFTRNAGEDVEPF